jgi:geranylgeranyl reductase family protein
MDDVLIVGAGPAGSVAAIVLARAGARVRLIDRASFPRDKLCGDTINPGTLAVLRRLGLADAVESSGLEVEGMRITGERGFDLTARYPDALRGRAITRRRFDQTLVDAAIAAGVRFEPSVAAHAVVVEGDRLRGVVCGANGRRRELLARVTIAADGRHSTLAFGLGLARHPDQPRRWAVGAYFEDPGPAPRVGEMHIRRGRYVGVAPLPSGLVNICVVQPWTPGARAFGDAEGLLRREIAADAMLRDRFAGARIVAPPVVLGPLAVDGASADAVPEGLLIAGDAAGFVDPMTGDGLRFAVRGAEIAADAALQALVHGWSGVPARHAALRAAEFSSKWRLNRGLRALVGSPLALWLATAIAPLSRGVLRALVARAGDCDVADREMRRLQRVESLRGTEKVS